MKPTTRTITGAIAAAFILLGAQAAFAEPMKCSGEQKTCTTGCARLPQPLLRLDEAIAKSKRQRRLMRRCREFFKSELS